ncbi:alpha/beta hydrolase [Saccharospirillum sp. MSK14-1]|uniref:alpha/beta fold hydrolase n=1 Tax=Saccharospirillum sp. MSK14-1 TaxID=1897632 RepID=UPI000D363A3A|nr:alpha/beta hydrolase [Saccharospirillum sp. MSK14-1]PTY36055.1 alpha/beta hydrolase [Saccharospirillum sp. MSK14-1]
MLNLDHRFDFEGHAIAWGTFGAGPALVLVHGFPFSSQVWRRIAPSLARRYRLYCFDLLGSGRSDKPHEVPSQTQGRLLKALLDHWQLDHPDVLAHDFGGLAALRALFVEGAQLGRLTLLDAVAVLPSGSPFFAHVREHEAVFAGLPSYAHQAMFEAYIQSAAYHTLSAEAHQTYFQPWQDAAGQAAFYRWIAQSNSAAIEELQPLYQHPPCPVRLLWGAEDTFIPPAQGQELARRLHLPPPELIPGAGHLVQEDAPEALVGLLLTD